MAILPARFFVGVIMPLIRHAPKPVASRSRARYEFL